jgi:RNA polymerase sigma factor (sigma-70 family)
MPAVPHGGPFPQTRHTMVADLRSDREEVRRAGFDALVGAYWKPVFKYVRLKWHASPDEAADLTQGFFLRAYEKAFFATFDPAKARFRTYLRLCLDGFVANEHKAGRRLKRGGDRTIVSLDFDGAERELAGVQVNAIRDFDEYFHREWLRSLFAAAADRLRATCAERGRPERFALFERYDLAAEDDQRPTYAQLAEDAGITATAVTNELAAARREFRRIVLTVLREQSASDEDFEIEARALTGAGADGDAV